MIECHYLDVTGRLSPFKNILQRYVTDAIGVVDSKLDICADLCLGHESHHCARIQKVPEHVILMDNIVTEGLACHFETETTGFAVGFELVARYLANADSTASEAVYIPANDILSVV